MVVDTPFENENTQTHIEMEELCGRSFQGTIARDIV